MRQRPSSVVALCILATTLGALAWNSYFGTERVSENALFRTHHIPQNAQQILSQCSATKASPGPSASFLEREVSDRFEPGTKSTLIRNATILTGGRNGTEVIFGDLLLDKGIVKGVGEIPDFRIARLSGDLTEVDANGAWLTPGLGQLPSKYFRWPGAHDLQLIYILVSVC
jgi:hypothetical protein